MSHERDELEALRVLIGDEHRGPQPHAGAERNERIDQALVGRAAGGLNGIADIAAEHRGVEREHGSAGRTRLERFDALRHRGSRALDRRRTRTRLQQIAHHHHDPYVEIALRRALAAREQDARAGTNRDDAHAQPATLALERRQHHPRIVGVRDQLVFGR